MRWCWRVARPHSHTIAYLGCEERRVHRRVSAGMGTKERSWLKPRTRRGGLSQPLSQCKHVLIEIRSSGYNSFADVAARPPFAHPPPRPPTLSSSMSVLAVCLPPPKPLGSLRLRQKFDKFAGCLRFDDFLTPSIADSQGVSRACGFQSGEPVGKEIVYSGFRSDLGK